MDNHRLYNGPPVIDNLSIYVIIYIDHVVDIDFSEI